MASLSYKSPLARQLTGFIFLAIATALFMLWQSKPNLIFLFASILMTFVGAFRCLTYEETVFKKGEAKAKKRTHYFGFYKVEEQCEFDVVDMMCNDHMLARWEVYITQSDDMMRQKLSKEDFAAIKNKSKKQPGLVAIVGATRNQAVKSIKDIKEYCSLVQAEPTVEEIEENLDHLSFLPHHEDWELERKNAHPAAVQLLDKDFYWDYENEDSPLGNDIGAQVLHDYSEAIDGNLDLDDFEFLQKCFAKIKQEKEKIEDITEDIKDSFSQKADKTVIGLCFASFVLKGKVHPQIKALALQSVENQLVYSNSQILKSLGKKIEKLPTPE